jgi:hypothetical protein
VLRRIAGAEQDPDGRLLASQLARLECRVKPLRANDAALLATYDAFFTRARLLVAEVTAAVIDRATDLPGPGTVSRRRTRFTLQARSKRGPMCS